jgi:hypothetical protein
VTSCPHASFKIHSCRFVGERRTLRTFLRATAASQERSYCRTRCVASVRIEMEIDVDFHSDFQNRVVHAAIFARFKRYDDNAILHGYFAHGVI